MGGLLIGLGAVALAAGAYFFGRTARAEDGGMTPLPEPPPVDGPDPIPDIPVANEAGRRAISFVRPDPTAGAWYQIVSEDNQLDVARTALWGAALDAGLSISRDDVPGNVVVRLARLMSAPTTNLEAESAVAELWNARLYGKPSSSLAAFRGTDIGVAYNPVNEDAVARLALGRFPRRTVGIEGQPVGGAVTGSSFGLVWVPRLNPEGVRAAVQGRSVAAELFLLDHEDGSSALGPPRTVTEALQP